MKRMQCESEKKKKKRDRFSSWKEMNYESSNKVMRRKKKKKKKKERERERGFNAGRK